MLLSEEFPKTYKDTTVYAVDDDVEYLEVFRIAASKFSELSLETFTKPAPFAQILATRPKTIFVLFFLDIRLGPTLGFELCEKVRESAAFSSAPVIFMSSSQLQADINRASRVGANSYFHKPTGTRARVEAVRRQLTYWLNDVKMPTAEERTPELEKLETLTIVPQKANTRSRGTPLYALDRLRQDILVGLLRDLTAMSGQAISQSVSDKIIKSLTRFQEIFLFMSDVFGTEVLNSISDFVYNISMWTLLGRTKFDDNETIGLQQNCLNKAKSARISFNKALHNSRLDGVSEDLFLRLDSWIWDVFNELGDLPSFRSLYVSLRRFQSRAF